MFLHKRDFSQEELAEKLWQLCQKAYAHGAPWTQQQFLTDLAEPHSEYLLLLRHGELAGFIGYHWLLEEAELHNVAVAEIWQRQGLADQLLAQLLQELTAQKIEKVFLEVRESNAAAQALYRKWQFQACGLRKNYYRQPSEHGLLMQRERLS